MRRFAFPLERVRQWRSAQLDIEQVRLQSLLAAVGRLDEEAAALDRRLDQAEQNCRYGLEAGQEVDLKRFRDLEKFRFHVTRRKRRLADEKSRIEPQVARQRLNVVEAERNYELLNRLRRKAWRGWEQDYSRELESTAADLYLARWSA